jgi:L-alanine-DL-glutamate epimerase-like enolase superfamily enzyme
MTFSDTASQFLDFDLCGNCETLRSLGSTNTVNAQPSKPLPAPSGHKIAAIAISHHRLPLMPAFNASWDTKPRTHFDATIVRVTTDTGLVGVASGDRMLGFEGHEQLFVGQDPLALERHYRVLANIDFHYGRCWPLDLALWDLAGKILNAPCWKLLGGRSNRVRAYASSGTLRDPRAQGDAAERYLAQGFHALKLRFHRGDWHDDLRALESVRARVGTRLELMVDCNQGWRMSWDTETPWTFKDALAVARELERLKVYWMEEPLHRADHAGMRMLREATDVRIAAGEMTRQIHELRDLIAAGCVDVVQPDAALVGGITGLRGVEPRAARLHAGGAARRRPRGLDHPQRGAGDGLRAR